MPAASISDIEFHTPTNELIVSTHGRGIYKIDLTPLYKIIPSYPLNTNVIMAPGRVTRPKFNDTFKESLLHAEKNMTITTWNVTESELTISIKKSDSEKALWSVQWPVSYGFNQFRWDLAYKFENNLAPYFIHHTQYLESGSYSLTVGTETWENTSTLEIIDDK